MDLLGLGVMKNFHAYSAEHEILYARKYIKNSVSRISVLCVFTGTDKPVLLLFMPTNVKMPTNV